MDAIIKNTLLKSQRALRSYSSLLTLSDANKAPSNIRGVTLQNIYHGSDSAPSVFSGNTSIALPGMEDGDLFSVNAQSSRSYVLCMGYDGAAVYDGFSESDNPNLGALNEVVSAVNGAGTSYAVMLCAQARTIPPFNNVGFSFNVISSDVINRIQGAAVALEGKTLPFARSSSSGTASPTTFSNVFLPPFSCFIGFGYNKNTSTHTWSPSSTTGGEDIQNDHTGEVTTSVYVYQNYEQPVTRNFTWSVTTSSGPAVVGGVFAIAP